MVAEPVLATLGALRASYDAATRFLLAHTPTLPDTSTFLQLPLDYFGSPDPPPAVPATFFDRLEARVHARRHELVFALFTGLGAASLVFYRRRRLMAGTGVPLKRRRAPKLANGARRDVVLVVGSPTEPMTRLLAVDFEKRGFIVYLTVLDEKDARYVALNTVTDDTNYVDLSGGVDFAAVLGRFGAMLHEEVVPVPGAAPHVRKLRAVVFAPNLYFPVGPVENTAGAAWERVILRLAVCTGLLGLGLVPLVREQQSRVLCVIPTIVSSLRLLYHGPEAVFQNALKDLFGTLAKEVRAQGVCVTQVRLGNLHVANTRTLPASQKSKIAGVAEAEVRSWPEEMQRLYGAPFLRAQAQANPVGQSPGSQGLRGLHHLLFDLMLAPGRTPLVVYYGSGARTYERLSGLLPTSVLEMFS